VVAMQIIPILDAIETILKEDTLTKKAIASYYNFEVPSGATKLPICCLNVARPAEVTERALGGHSASMSYFTSMIVSITILGRAYAYGSTYMTEMTALDVIQDKICTVFNKPENNNLDGAVTQQAFQYLRSLPPQKEYCGFEIGFIIEGGN